MIVEPLALVPAATQVRSVNWNGADSASTTIYTPGTRSAKACETVGVVGGLGLKVNVAGLSAVVV